MLINIEESEQFTLVKIIVVKQLLNILINIMKLTLNVDHLWAVKIILRFRKTWCFETGVWNKTSSILCIKSLIGGKEF